MSWLAQKVRATHDLGLHNTKDDIWKVERLPAGDTPLTASGDGAPTAITTYTLHQEAHNEFLTVKAARSAYGGPHLGLPQDSFSFRVVISTTSARFGDNAVFVQIFNDESEL